MSLLARPVWAADPVGIWLSDTGAMRIRIAPCGAAYCGTLIWLREPRNDVFNPDSTKRGQPLLGMRLFSGMVPAANPGEWKGSGYDPNDGRTYAETMFMQDDRLLTQGCVVGGAICHSAAWTRVN